MIRYAPAVLALSALPMSLDAQRPVVQHEITTPGVDYAFQAPAALPSGWTAIRFENHGTVDHELVLLRLRPGRTLADVMEVMQADGDRASVVDGFGGVLIADPGEIGWGRLLVHLEAGRTYLLVCNFRDHDDAPPHAALGMVASFTVE